MGTEVFKSKIVDDVEEGTLRKRIQKMWEQNERDKDSHSSATSRKIEGQDDNLNAAFFRVPVSFFPVVDSVIEIPSDYSVEEALAVLTKNHILSAPVKNMDANEDSGWLEKYSGMIDFSTIVFYVLGLAKMKKVPSGTFPPDTNQLFEENPSLRVNSSLISGDFFQTLKESGLAKSVQVADICGTFRWGPFIPVSGEDSILTLLLLLSKYGVKSIPVVEPGKPAVQNIITQSSVVNLLNECDGLEWFDRIADKTLDDLRLPVMSPEKVIKVEDGSLVLDAFKKMVDHWIGGLAVVESGTNQIVANISAKDIRLMIMNPERFPNHREMTVKEFLQVAQIPHGSTDEISPMMIPPLTCKKSDTLRTVIQRLHTCRIHRLYMVDDSSDLIGVVTLTDIIGKFVYEPADYFGDFFNCWGSTLSSPVK